MAQSNVPECGGSGQWMHGGMTMAGDMLNDSIKAAVDNRLSLRAGFDLNKRLVQLKILD